MIEPEPTKEQPNHSEKIVDYRSVIGIASVAGGLLALLSMLFLFVDLFLGTTTNIVPPFLTELVVEGSTWFVSLCICLPSLAGVMLGAVGLTLKNIRTRTAAIGLILSLLTAIVFCGILIWAVIYGLSGV